MWYIFIFGRSVGGVPHRAIIQILQRRIYYNVQTRQLNVYTVHRKYVCLIGMVMYNL